MSGRLTTHVLDISRGTPAVGMRVQLWRLAEDGGRRLLLEIITNEDGRYREPLLSEEGMEAGTYELVFDVGEYYRGGEQDAFLERVPVRFRLADPEAHYHVPLLVAPGGYSTYRGS